MDYEIRGNVLRAAGGAEKAFAFPIEQVEVIGDTVVVLLHVSHGLNENVFGLTRRLDERWQVARRAYLLPTSPYIEMRRVGAHIRLFGWDGMVVDVDPQTAGSARGAATTSAPRLTVAPSAAARLPRPIRLAADRRRRLASRPTPMKWPEKLSILCEIYGLRTWNEQPDTLNDAERTLACVPPFGMEMNGGSFWAFFHNSSGDMLPETLDALRRIGAHRSAALLSEAVRIYFGGREVPRDTVKRRRLLSEIDADRTAEANRVSHAYVECDERIDDLLLAYAQAHEAELRLTEDEAATATPVDGNWRQCTKCWDAWEQSPDEKLARCPACQALTFLRANGTSAPPDSPCR